MRPRLSSRRPRATPSAAWCTARESDPRRPRARPRTLRPTTPGQRPAAFAGAAPRSGADTGHPSARRDPQTGWSGSVCSPARADAGRRQPTGRAVGYRAHPRAARGRCFARTPRRSRCVGLMGAETRGSRGPRHPARRVSRLWTGRSDVPTNVRTAIRRIGCSLLVTRGIARGSPGQPLAGSAPGHKGRNLCRHRAAETGPRGRDWGRDPR